jgi:hypothetical protein
MTIGERLSVGETLAHQFGFLAHLFNRIEVGLSAARVRFKERSGDRSSFCPGRSWRSRSRANSCSLGANKDAVRWPPSNTGPLYGSNKNDCALAGLDTDQHEILRIGLT